MAKSKKDTSLITVLFHQPEAKCSTLFTQVFIFIFLNTMFILLFVDLATQVLAMIYYYGGLCLSQKHTPPPSVLCIANIITSYILIKSIFRVYVYGCK